MKYFVAEANPEFYQPELKNWYNILNPRLISQCRYDEIPGSLIFEVEPNPRAFVTDIISFPYFMITYEAESVLKLYDPRLSYCRMDLFDTLNGNVKPYLLPFFETIDCLTDKTTYTRDHSDVISPVMNLNKTAGLSIFRPMGFSNKKAVISLELAESLLRRKIRGLFLTEIELEV